ncbi:hypothetical protein ACP70R_050248 [Stipagrostis hirtigluma subsp. patula]
MAAVSPLLTTSLPLRPLPRRLAPDAFAVSVAPHRAGRVALRGYWSTTLAVLHCWHCHPLARNFHGFESAMSLWTEHNKQALFASERDSPSTGTKQSSSSDDSSDGPPVLTILAGVIVFLLVLWVLGSIITWIVGLAFGGSF